MNTTLDRLSRRGLMLGAGALVLGGAACGQRPGEANGVSTLTDLRDRPLNVSPPVSRLTIDDGRYLIGLALIHPDPVSLLSAWSGDINRISPEMHAAFVERFPALATLPVTPSSAADFSVEAVLAAAPEVA